MLRVEAASSSLLRICWTTQADALASFPGTAGTPGKVLHCLMGLARPGEQELENVPPDSRCACCIEC